MWADVCSSQRRPRKKNVPVVVVDAATMLGFDIEGDKTTVSMSGRFGCPIDEMILGKRNVEWLHF